MRDLGIAWASAGSGPPGAWHPPHCSPTARSAGIEVRSRPGLGGVHRDSRAFHVRHPPDPDDASGLSRSRWCARMKSILDVPATLERLETLNVTVLGFQTTRFPGFYLTDSGSGVDWRVEHPAEDSRLDREPGTRLRHTHAGDRGGKPLARGRPGGPGVAQRGLAFGTYTIAAGATAARTHAVPATFHRETKGASLEANISASSCVTPRWPLGSPWRSRVRTEQPRRRPRRPDDRRRRPGKWRPGDRLGHTASTVELVFCGRWTNGGRRRGVGGLAGGVDLPGRAGR